MPYATRDDWQLLNVGSHEPEALAELFRRHKDRVYRVAWTLVGKYGGADDVTQDVFVRLARISKRHRADAKFTTWLHRVTLNVARDWLRRQSRHTSADSDDAIADTASQPSIDPLLHDLVTAMQALTERQREVLTLRVLEGYSTKETARIAGCSSGSVKTHLHRALAHVKPYLS